jgi:hypothetical protein
MGFADFVIICLGSCVIGYIVPCLTAIVLKRVELKGHVVLEMSVYLLMSYVPYVLAQVRDSATTYYILRSTTYTTICMHTLLLNETSTCTGVMYWHTYAAHIRSAGFHWCTVCYHCITDCLT